MTREEMITELSHLAAELKAATEAYAPVREKVSGQPAIADEFERQLYRWLEQRPQSTGTIAAKAKELFQSALTAKDAEIAATQKRFEIVSRLSANRGVLLAEYFDSVQAAGIDAEFADGDPDPENDNSAPDKLLAWVKSQTAKDAEIARLKSAFDTPICRLQFPDGTVPTDIEDCAQGWKRAYDSLNEKLKDALAAKEMP